MKHLVAFLLLLVPSLAFGYTATWDETIPPDSELASLLGQNLRDLRRDIRERIQTCTNFGTPTDTGLPKLTSCWQLIGFDAGKPSSPPNGELYYATDTKKWYVASGGSWVFAATIDYTSLTINARNLVLTGSGAENYGIDMNGENWIISAMRFSKVGEIKYRNAANSADLHLIGVDGSDAIHIGDSLSTGIFTPGFFTVSGTAGPFIDVIPSGAITPSNTSWRWAVGGGDMALQENDGTGLVDRLRLVHSDGSIRFFKPNGTCVKIIPNGASTVFAAC